MAGTTFPYITGRAKRTSSALHRMERYRNGDLSSKDIAFYQDQLSREQLNEVGALINYRLALLDLKIRTLWDFVADEPVVTLDPDY